MNGHQGNPNLFSAAASAFVSYSNSSEAVTLPVGTVAVTLTSTAKCWVKIGQPGETPTAAAPSGEKVWADRLLAVSTVPIDIAVPDSIDSKLVQIAVIRDGTTDGTLDIIARK